MPATRTTPQIVYPGTNIDAHSAAHLLESGAKKGAAAVTKVLQRQ